MSRLIDADALMQDVIAHSYPLTNAFSVGGVDDGMFTNGFQQVVDEQPTVDAVPIVHGEWIKHNNPNYSPFDNSKSTNRSKTNKHLILTARKCASKRKNIKFHHSAPLLVFIIFVEDVIGRQIASICNKRLNNLTINRTLR